MLSESSQDESQRENRKAKEQPGERSGWSGKVGKEDDDAIDGPYNQQDGNHSPKHFLFFHISNVTDQDLAR